jgi:hypothetical protein
MENKWEGEREREGTEEGKKRMSELGEKEISLA